MLHMEEEGDSLGLPAARVCALRSSELQCSVRGKLEAPPRQPRWTTAHPLWPGHVDHSGIFPTWVCVSRQPEFPLGVNCSLMNDRTQITTLTLSVIFNLCLFSIYLQTLPVQGTSRVPPAGACTH